MQIFVDSDVVISSLLSQFGASFSLLNSDSVKPIISPLSQKEIEIVCDRLNINKRKLTAVLKNKLHIVHVAGSLSEIKQSFTKYVFDINDSHIVAGAKAARVKFLITYNVKDFKIDKIKKDLDIVVLTPGKFLQYLRSVK